MSGVRDPAEVTLGVATILVTTDCCETRMAPPRERVDLALGHRLMCLGCTRSRQVDLVRAPRVGVRAAWSAPPGQRRWRWPRW
ncbi:MAG: hypothetical protein ACRDYX_14860 [Egibacteraceae bacterium]